MVAIKTKMAHRNNYGNQRDVSQIEYLVIHYTSNDGDTDEGNGNYFANNIVKASAHYFVDDDSITQTVPDNYAAWAVGGTKYPSCSYTGGGKFYGICTNTNSISIEICDDVKNGVVYPSAKTIENALDLARMIMKKYNIPKDRVIRHFEVTGKLCPAYWCGDTSKDKLWKTEFWDKLDVVDSQEEIEVRYNTVAECPKWAQPTIQKLIDEEFLNGDGNGLDLSYDMVRMLVILDRAGMFD